MLGILIMMSALFYSCGGKKTGMETDAKECTRYSCPMHADRTATEPVQCPECGMEMTPSDTVIGN